MRSPRFRIGLAALAVAALPAAFAAVRAQAGSTRAGVTPAQLIAQLPASLRAWYVGNTDPIMPSAYGSFKAVKTPWKLCYADSYEGNDWRIVVRKELERLAAQFKAAGKVSGITTSVSNGDVALQNSQIRSFVNQGCSVILTIPTSATGINAAVQAAYKKGIPVVTFSGAVTSQYAINADWNNFLWGRDMATMIATTLKGTGNVVEIDGIAGNPVEVAERQGAESIWKKYPGIHVIAHANGNWTPAPTKTAMIQVLSTHPQKIDAVWDAGSEATAIAESFRQSGRPYPRLITASPTGDSIAYAKQHADVQIVGDAILPSWAADSVFRIAVRLLDGQHPKLNTLMVPIPHYNGTQLLKWYAPCMKTSSVTPFPIASTDALPEALMNRYFTNGRASPPYNYKTIPAPCA